MTFTPRKATLWAAAWFGLASCAPAFAQPPPTSPDSRSPVAPAVETPAKPTAEPVRHDAAKIQTAVGYVFHDAGNDNRCSPGEKGLPGVQA